MRGAIVRSLLIALWCAAELEAAPTSRPDVALETLTSNSTLPLSASVCQRLLRACPAARQPSLTEQIEHRVNELKRQSESYKDVKKRRKKELKRLKKQLKRLKDNKWKGKEVAAPEERLEAEEEHESLCDLLLMEAEEDRLCRELVNKERQLREDELTASVVESMIREAEERLARPEWRDRLQQQAENLLERHRDDVSDAINRALVSQREGEANDDVDVNSRRQIATFGTGILCEATLSKTSDRLITVRCVAANFQHSLRREE